ncbi:MAG TPA: carbon monoxide dehydrogenase subunit G [Candidatus Eisenbacteria bacterium]|nr:carbon monoxide dehydrogenase subunit G [Candidatus Eisenbacteria bacterium]
MQFSGSVDINAPRDRVWAFVSDLREVGSCGPGVESIDAVDATHFTAHAKVSLGFIVAGIIVNLEVLEADPPDRVVFRASGQAQGTAVDATGELRLSGPAGGPTTLDWSASVAISGAFAGAGSRLIETSADRQIGQAFDCIRAKLEA